MNDVKFTIITVVFNNVKTIEDTIQSIIQQSYTNFEYIVVDGGSNDGTLAILEKYRGEISVLISEPDEGIYDAMNKGIRCATGELIGIVNSDDWLENDALMNVCKSYQENVDVYYGFIRTIKSESEFSVSRFSHNFINEKMIHHPATFISRNTYARFGLYDLSYKMSADYDFILRLYNGGAIFQPVNHIISNFREGGVSSTVNAMIDTIRVKEKNGILVRKMVKFKVWLLKIKEAMLCF
ncbi:glycosyltransferase family 2 protein [Aeromonas caviae]